MRMRLIPVAALVAVVGCDRGPDEAMGGALPVHGGNTSVKHRATELSGGTLVVAGGGRFAVMSDPDNDQLWVVDLSLGKLRGKVALPAGSQPERLVEDGDGRVRVALRGSGQVATVSPTQLAVTATDDACPEVRGLSWSKASSALLVACAGGELVTFKGSAKTVTHPATDLRDAIETQGKVWVSRFRTAAFVPVDAAGSAGPEVTLPTVPIGTTPSTFVPGVAWRTTVTPKGQLITVHQRTVDGDISAIQVPAAPPAVPYYQNICNSSIVHSTVSVIDNGEVIGSADIAGVLPIDLAVSPDGTEVAVAQPGSRQIQRLSIWQVSQGTSGGICTPSYPDTAPVGQATGVAYTPQGELVVQTREPSAVWVLGTSGNRTQKEILLTATPIDDPGHALFHDATGAISCASCHPEGTDDGHTWTLFQQKVRTQSLEGGVVETAPFHWSGSIPNIKALLDDTFVTRMGGKTPTPAGVTALTDWMEAIPRQKVATPADAPSVELIDHGRELFHQASVGCTHCHSGDLLTNNSTVDVGTGGRFQVPSLRGVSLRGPWMHDGCAKTLKDRFGSCGGTAHGETSKLTDTDVDALVSYLGTL